MSENKKAILKIDGKEIEVEITQEQFEKLYQKKTNTGYERVEDNKTYYYIAGNGLVLKGREGYTSVNDDWYKAANYHSDETVAKNNARADKLMRQLRRFAVEHREKPIDWKKTNQHKFYIYYTNKYGISIGNVVTLYDFGSIYFDTKESAQLAIDTFKDELLWYFTEYKDSL